MRSLATKISIAFAPMITLYGAQLSVNMVAGDICKRINNLDSVLHTLGGFLTAWTGLLLYRVLKEYHPHAMITPRLFFSAMLVWFTTFVGVAWEWYEFFSDRYLHTSSQLSIADTLKDIFLDIIGAGVFILILTHRSRNAKLKPGEY